MYVCIYFSLFCQGVTSIAVSTQLEGDLDYLLDSFFFDKDFKWFSHFVSGFELQVNLLNWFGPRVKQDVTHEYGKSKKSAVV